MNHPQITYKLKMEVSKKEKLYTNGAYIIEGYKNRVYLVGVVVKSCHHGVFKEGESIKFPLSNHDWYEYVDYTVDYIIEHADSIDWKIAAKHIRKEVYEDERLRPFDLFWDDFDIQFRLYSFFQSGTTQCHIP